LGGIAGLNYYLFYFERWDENQVYWSTAYQLGLSGNINYHFADKKLLEVDLHFPVFALVSRTPSEYSGEDDDVDVLSYVLKKAQENLTPTSIHHYLSMNAYIAYSLFNKKNKKRSLFFKTCYIGNNLPDSKELRILRYQFGYSFVF
jgi:hypothetical protein